MEVSSFIWVRQLYLGGEAAAASAALQLDLGRRDAGEEFAGGAAAAAGRMRHLAAWRSHRPRGLAGPRSLATTAAPCKVGGLELVLTHAFHNCFRCFLVNKFQLCSIL